MHYNRKVTIPAVHMVNGRVHAKKLRLLYILYMYVHVHLHNIVGPTTLSGTGNINYYLCDIARFYAS